MRIEAAEDHYGLMHIFNRRNFLGKSLKLAPLFATPGLMAEQLTRTPYQTPGPFYPDKLPLDTDNDLIVINDALTPSVGTVAYLGGKVSDIKGNPYPKPCHQDKRRSLRME